MNRHRPVTRDHPIHRLPELVASVRRELGLEGEAPQEPPPPDNRGALRFLRRPRDVQSSGYRDIVARTDYGNASDHVRHFCARLYKEMAKQKIPIRLFTGLDDPSAAKMLFVRGQLPAWVVSAQPADAVIMVHATEDRGIPWSAWPVLRQIARVAANGAEVVLHEDAESLVYPWLLIVEKGSKEELLTDAYRQFRHEERKWMEEFRKDRLDPSERGRKGE